MPKRRAARTLVRIRCAGAADVPRLVVIENAVFATDRMSARQWRHHVAHPGATVLVAERDRAIVGAAVVFFHASHRIARLYSIAAAPEARGAGIGEELLGATEHDARRHGRDRLRLEVRTDNAAARRLYERRGYRAFGTKAAYYEDGCDAVRYEKALSPSRP